jgi:hypothetical protein
VLIADLAGNNKIGKRMDGRRCVDRFVVGTNASTHSGYEAHFGEVCQFEPPRASDVPRQIAHAQQNAALQHKEISSLRTRAAAD